MKRIILSAILMSFAVAVQAGDAKTAQDTTKDTGSCCSSKVKVSTEAKESSCPFAKAACCKQSSAKQTAAKRPVLMSPKAMSLASN
jgi:hypothetical protein